MTRPAAIPGAPALPKGFHWHVHTSHGAVHVTLCNRPEQGEHLPSYHGAACVLTRRPAHRHVLRAARKAHAAWEERTRLRAFEARYTEGTTP